MDLTLKNYDVYAVKQDEVYAYIYCKRESLNTSLDILFKFRPDGYQFDKRYKRGFWDGYIHLYNKKLSLLPIGLLPELKSFCSRNRLSFGVDEAFKNKPKFSKEFIVDQIKQLKLPYKLYGYQFRAIFYALNHQRMITLSVTGSGKSLMIYCVMKILDKLFKETNEKLLLSVDGSLCSQLLGDFAEYAQNDDNFNPYKDIQIIGLSKGKFQRDDRSIVMGTWQSLKNKKPNYFNNFYGVIADEVHSYEAPSMKHLMTNLKFASFRLGYTGTLRDSKANQLAIIGYFGKDVRISNYDELIDKERLSNIIVKQLVLKHSKEDCKLMKQAKYVDEITYLNKSVPRNKFLLKLLYNIGKDDSNSLVLTTSVINHGFQLYRNCKKLLEPLRYHVFFVNKDIKDEKRQEIRKFLENNTKCIVIATYQIYNKGVNIKNLQKCVFTSSTKSTIRVLQSIGRTLRLDGKKNQAFVYDIADDLRTSSKSQPNHTLKHFIKRKKIYDSVGFDNSYVEYDL